MSVPKLQDRLAARGYPMSRGALVRLASDEPIEEIRLSVVRPILRELQVPFEAVFEEMSVKQRVFLSADNTFKVKYAMEKLAAGEQAEPRPQAPTPPIAQGAPAPMPPGAYPPPQPGAYPPPQPPRGPGTRRMPPPPPSPPGSEPRGAASEYGSIAIRVQPSDAEVSIDGEPWRAPSGQERLVVDVSEGSHTIEIRKSGYRTYVTQVDVRRGVTTPLNVSLRGEQ